MQASKIIGIPFSLSLFLSFNCQTCNAFCLEKTHQEEYSRPVVRESPRFFAEDAVGSLSVVCQDTVHSLSKLLPWLRVEKQEIPSQALSSVPPSTCAPTVVLVFSRGAREVVEISFPGISCLVPDLAVSTQQDQIDEPLSHCQCFRASPMALLLSTVAMEPFSLSDNHKEMERTSMVCDAAWTC